MMSSCLRHTLLLACSLCAILATGQAAIMRQLERDLAGDGLSMHERARALERLSWYQCGADPVRAMEAAEEAIMLAERINDPSLLGSAIVRRVAAKQTSGDRTGDVEDLNKAVSLLKEHGPEKDLGYAYWCLFMELSEVADQDSLCDLYYDQARALFDRHHEATGRYWVMYTEQQNGSPQPKDTVTLERALEKLVSDSHDTCLIVGHYSYKFNNALAREDFARAERIANEHLALSRAVPVPFEQFVALSNLQYIATVLGDNEQAIHYGLLELALVEELRMTTIRRWIHSDVAVRFADLNDHASATEHLLSALSLDGGPTKPWDRFQIITNLAISLLKAGDLDSGLVVLHDAERLFAAGANGSFVEYESTWHATLLQHLGIAYRQKGDLSRSRAYLEHGSRVADHPDLRMNRARIRVELARTLALGGPADRQAALAEANTVLALAAQENWLEMTRDARFALYEVYDHAGDASAALQNLRLYMTAKDSLMDLERIKNINALNKRFESERKDAELKDLSIANAQQEQEISAHRRQNLVLLVGIGVVLIIGALLFALLRNARRSRTLLAEKNAAILDAQTKLVESERAREASEVRTRIARDVHDQLGSDLTKLVMLSTEAKALAHEDIAAMPGIANDIERIAGEANRSLGDIVWSIDPHHDSLAGLTERVRAHAERMLKWSKVEHSIECAHEGPDRSLDPATKRDIYLIFREALNNAIKYAKAGHIRVMFRTSATHAGFEVEDDGVGMDTNSGSGFGMGNMHARAQRIGGTLHVQSSAEKGTLLTFAVMLPTEPHA